MKTQKGYILPIILVIILLILAGFIIFTQKQVIAPESEEDLFATSTTDIVDFSPVATTTDSAENTPVDNTVSTSTDSTEEVSVECVENEDCSGDQVCYFKPGGTVGACTNL